MGLIAALGLPAVAAAAQPVDFAGKRVELVVPFPPGGGADVYARALAPHLEKHLPGKPTIIVRNVPGGGSITGANQFNARAKPDGLTVLVASASTVMNFVFQRSRMELDLTRAEPVILSPQGSVAYVAPSLGVKGPKDIAKLKGQTLAFGGSSPTSTEVRWLTAFELLGLTVKPVWGVARGPARRAVERGELNLNDDTNPAYLKSGPQLVKAGKAVPLFALGVLDEKGNVVRDPNFPDLPSFPEAYELMHGKKPSGVAYDAWKAAFQIGVMANKLIVLPPGTPAAVVETWRGAIRKVLDDPEFEKYAAAVIEGYPQFVGEAARPILKEATTLTPQVWEWLKSYLKTHHGVDI